MLSARRSLILTLAITVALGALALAGAGAAGASSGSGGSSPHASSAPPPAPPSYSRAVVHAIGGLRMQLRRLARVDAGVAALAPSKSVAAAQKRISALSDAQMASLYASTPGAPARFAQASEQIARLTRAVAASATGGTGAPRAAAQPSEVTPPDCGTPPDARAVQTAKDAIASAEIVLDAIPQALTEGVIALGEGAVTTFPDPFRVAAQAALSAAEVAVNELEFKVEEYERCENTAHRELLRKVANDLVADVATIVGKIADLSNLVDQRTTTIIDQNKTIIAQNDLNLKLTIQHALLGESDGQLGTFVLPASAGGYLDSKPIGVQSVVTDTLAALRAAGERVAPSAPRTLQLADSVLAAHDYKSAFALYQQAYRQMVS